MSTQDRVCSMLQHERFRGRYRVTKVTVKMLYAVNFGSRPIDHFLSSEDPVAYAPDRTVIHEDAQWGGAEPPPAHQIRRADQLHHVLYAIQDAAAEWYPMDVVAVFRAVHSHAVRDVPGTAPPQEIHAICNLYSAVFGGLFDGILHRVHSRDLLDRALQALRRDSPVYQQFVARVLDDAVHRAVLRTPAHNSGGQQGQRQPAVRSKTRRPATARRPPGGAAAQPSVIPEATRTQIPVSDGTQVCMRFQVEKDCTFPRCPHVHELVTLPPDVLKWVTTHHGVLKSGHPQRT